MCLAIPGKITTVEGRRAVVAYPSQTRPAMIGDIKVKVGDFVLVQMGIIIKKLTPKEAETALKAWTNK
ncbi:MAG: HypC/HybG/HupF family hydrogenase formation chaperone [Patescibacteria group bacterium]|jgi:hydrogenase expression/formation protein HypC